MAIKVYKPTSNARRQMSVSDFRDLTTKTPEKSLIFIKKKTSGRNATGRITVRHRGGEHKRYCRIIDFKRDKFDIPARVATIEYDPGRNARIGLLFYKDGEKRYTILPVGVGVGEMLVSSKGQVEYKPGNATTLENIPVGSLVYNVELTPGQGGKIARSAGTKVKLMAVEGKYAQLKMPSGEFRMIPKEALATVGEVNNPEFMHIKIGKAGRTRHMGIRPTVRGKAMNPVDHPHGGGEGAQPIGLKHPKTPWGRIAIGGKTRNPKKASSRLILKRRNQK
ncbi:MAG: 50S ribosomal protein L2 [Candidatus Falkowbacteria bacterium]